MKNILVPIDFSGSSVHAASYAVQIARKLKPGKIILSHCLEPVLIASEVPYPQPYYTGYLPEDSVRQLSELKSKLLSDLDSPTSIDINTSDKPITKTINALVEIENVDLVVMGSTEKGALEKILVGSHTLDLIRSSHVPVLVVPQRKLSPEIRKIAFATDLKDHRAVPVKAIKSIVSAFNAQLSIVNVAKDGVEDFDPDDILTQEYLHKHWDTANAEFHYITHKSIADGIRTFSKDQQIDLLILVPQHRNFFENLFHNSITKEFSFDNDIPVIFINEEHH